MPLFRVTYRNTWGIPMAPIFIEADSELRAQAIAIFQRGAVSIIAIDRVPN